MASEDKKSKREHIIHFEDTPSKSLDEVNGSVEVPHNAGFWKTLAAYTGPGILVAVGYMDPGNWITSMPVALHLNILCYLSFLFPV